MAVPAFEAKICEPAKFAQRCKGLERPLVFTNGVFDLLHRGHVTYLAQARALGASLVVALNSDASVRRLGKGDERDTLERGHDGKAILECVERAVATLAEPADRRVRVERHDERGAERARFREVSHVAAMENVEHAVGEHQRAGELLAALREFRRRADLRLESRDSRAHAVAGPRGALARSSRRKFFRSAALSSVRS